MDTFPIFVYALLAVALVMFALGVLAGWRAGHRAGRIEAIDEMQPSYSILLTALSKVPNQYKDMNYSANNMDALWKGMYKATREPIETTEE